MRPLAGRTGWRAAGEITVITCPAWEQALERLSRLDEAVCHLELSSVSFVDVAGASALAATAQELPRGRRIVLDRPPATLRRLLDMFWPDLTAIEVAPR
ncbi:STAS domain-containing protein [Streptomyces sp. NBC_01275]|uniref:STAS domain-containing protein n=1 Tax=Streptomyces sp. NBC_01275 TaxID=2903807 RepID=UPI002250021C|nr:STAS domain-containing protein [Streptomyces sp. NBC_01275]MCX4767322.1 STAS domain-containing protein [Streptomyces sp. NBC_01275]